MGLRRPALRHGHNLVLGRRRCLHGLYFHRGSRTGLRRGRGGIFRGALHRHHLSVDVPGLSPPVECLPQARLHHRGRLREGPFRQPLAGARGVHHRHRRDHALHRPAAGRLAGGDRCDRGVGHGLDGRYAVVHRLRDSGRFHLFQRSARAGLDRHRQGHPDLRDRNSGRHRGSRSSSAASARYSPRYRRTNCCWRCRVRTPPVHTVPTPPWRWARRSRCFFTRTL